MNLRDYQRSVGSKIPGITEATRIAREMSLGDKWEDVKSLAGRAFNVQLPDAVDLEDGKMGLNFRFRVDRTAEDFFGKGLDDNEVQRSLDGGWKMFVKELKENGFQVQDEIPCKVDWSFRRATISWLPAD
jgi:hypothetical protein